MKRHVGGRFVCVLKECAVSKLVAVAGGGDPHFMMELSTLPFPLCFDVNGLAGEAYCLLRDPATGMMTAPELLWGFFFGNSAVELVS